MVQAGVGERVGIVLPGYYYALVIKGKQLMGRRRGPKHETLFV